MLGKFLPDILMIIGPCHVCEGRWEGEISRDKQKNLARERVNGYHTESEVDCTIRASGRKREREREREVEGKGYGRGGLQRKERTREKREESRDWGVWI